MFGDAGKRANYIPGKALGSESQVTCSSLVWLHKASAYCTTYPSAYPGGPDVISASRLTAPDPLALREVKRGWALARTHRCFALCGGGGFALTLRVLISPAGVVTVVGIAAIRPV